MPEKEIDSSNSDADGIHSLPLKKFSIAGFKAFNQEQRIPLKPITLVFGANSSGKSSILQSLILGHHAQKTGDLEAHKTEIGGDSVDLGGFRQYVHKRDHKEIVVLRYQFHSPTPHTFRSEYLRPFDEFLIELRIGLQPGEKGAGLAGYSASVGGEELFRMVPHRKDKLRIQLWQTDHPVSRSILERLCLDSPIRRPDDDAVAAFNTELHALLKRIPVESNNLPPHELSPDPDLRNEMVHGFDHTAPSDADARDPNTLVQHLLKRNFYRILDDILCDIHDLFEVSVGDLEYLGPLRKLPRRRLDDLDTTDQDPSSGALAWNKVKSDENVRNKVNAWLGSDRLQTRYHLKVRHLVHDESIRNSGSATINSFLRRVILQLVRRQQWDQLEALYDLEPDDFQEFLERTPTLLEDLAESFQEAHQQYLTDDGREEEAEKFTLEDAKEWVLNGANDKPGMYDDEIIAAHLEGSDDLAAFVSQQIDADREADSIADHVIKHDPDTRTELAIIELRNNTLMTHRDIGVGISQVLPVLVHAYASKRKLIAIEQPEIHIHPRLQAEIGDVFIESALGENKNTFLLETHSEHLILRILRRIRETTNGETVPFPITPDDVCVLYVQEANTGSEVIELPVTDDGDFSRPWPKGFFTERVEELF